MKKQIKATHEEGDELVPIEILEKSIIEIAQAFKAIGSTRLKQSTIITLLHDETKIPKRDIKKVLDNLESIEETFLNSAVMERLKK